MKVDASASLALRLRSPLPSVLPSQFSESRRSMLSVVLAANPLSSRGCRLLTHVGGALRFSIAAGGLIFAATALDAAVSDPMACLVYRVPAQSDLPFSLPLHRPAYSIIEDWVPVFDRALEELCRLRVAAKQLLIEALVRTIAHDEMLAPAEAA